MSIENIKYNTLNLNDLRSAIQGYDFEKKQLCQRTLEVSHIKYYTGIPDTFVKVNQEYYFMIASVPATSEIDDKIIDKAIGMLELQVNPYDNKVIWLKFVSVNEHYQNHGIATHLAREMCEFLKDKKWILERSTPSDMGERYIKSIINNLLKEYSIEQHTDEQLKDSFRKKKVK